MCINFRLYIKNVVKSYISRFINLRVKLEKRKGKIYFEQNFDISLYVFAVCSGPFPKNRVGILYHPINEIACISLMILDHNFSLGGLFKLRTIRQV